MRTKAWVNEGRWVAPCANPYCGGAEEQWTVRNGRFQPVGLGGVGIPRVKDDGTRFGIVGNKSHCGNCGQTSDVEWPEHRAEIAYALRARPVPETRNWTWGETVEDLLRENEAHGVD